MKEKLELVEVSPRDGLQNEPDVVSTENKLALIDGIIAAGFHRLEAASFVNPKKVPQMADGDAVFDGVRARADYQIGHITFIALALNPRGRFVGLAMNVTAFDSCAAHDCSVTIRPMIAPIGAIAVARRAQAFLGAATEFANGNDERLAQQSALIEVLEQCR